MLKRMVKKDAVKKLGDKTFSLTLINMVTPLSADLAPSGNVLDYLSVEINGEELTEDELKNIEIQTKDMKVTFSDFQEIDIIAIGQEVTFVITSDKLESVNVGDEITIQISVKEVNMNLKIERKVVSA